ncbi:MAG: CHASE2 domain-containing protein, partial [Gammaproteobacteria bacterium]|nr:CHASE2 domain-containing protein [Gammaproteobacteria bacterium]
MATAILSMNRMSLGAIPWRAAFIALSLASAGWALHYLGAFVAIDGIFYDRLIQIAPAAPANKNVMLVRSPRVRTVAEPYLWGQALTKLNALGAKQIVFTRLPEGSSASFVSQSIQAGNVIVGRAVISDPKNAQPMYLENWPVAAEQLKQGLVFIPDSEKGVHRYHDAALTVDGSIYKSLEVAAANTHTGTWVELKQDRYRINFSEPIADLPSVSLQQVVDDELISELVKGHTIVVGGARDVLSPGLVTPTSNRSTAMPLLEFQGVALNTLINNAQINVLNPAMVLLILTGLTLLNIFVYSTSSLRGGFSFTVFMMVL